MSTAFPHPHRVASNASATAEDAPLGTAVQGGVLLQDPIAPEEADDESPSARSSSHHGDREYAGGKVGENTLTSSGGETGKVSSRGEVIEKGPDGQDVIWVEFEADGEYHYAQHTFQS